MKCDAADMLISADAKPDDTRPRKAAMGSHLQESQQLYIGVGKLRSK